MPCDQKQDQACRACGSPAGIHRGPRDMSMRPSYCTKCWEHLTRGMRRERDTSQDEAEARPLASLEQEI